MSRAAPLIAMAALAAISALPAGARSVAAPCRAPGLSGRLHGTSGAAGTILLSLSFRNDSHAACSLRGYPALQLVGAPTRTRHGGLAILIRPVRTLTLPPGGYASLLVAYSDVPTGSEKRCPTTRRLLVTPSGARGAVTVKATIGACNHGLLRESPFLGGLRSAG